MSEQLRRSTFRYMMRREIAAILKTRSPALHSDTTREIAMVLLQLMKAASSLSDEVGLPGRLAGLREIRALAVQYLDQRLPG